MKRILSGLAVILLVLAVVVPAFAQQTTAPVQTTAPAQIIAQAQTTAQADCPPQATKPQAKGPSSVVPFQRVPHLISDGVPY